MGALKKQIARGTRVVRLRVRHEIAKLNLDTRDRIQGAQSVLNAGAAADAAFLLEPLLDKAGGAELVRGLFAVQVEDFDADVERRSAAGDREKALVCARLAWSLKPTAARAFTLLGQLRAGGHLDEAGAFLQEVGRRFPKEPAFPLHAAILKSELGQGDEAVALLWKFMGQRATVSASDRRIIARILRAYARECHSAGVEFNGPHPLVDPDVAIAYNQDIEKNVGKWMSTHFASQMFSDHVTRRQQRVGARNPRPHDSGRPLRTLFITAGNWHFLTNLLEHYENDDKRFEVRTFDFAPVQEALRDDLHAIFGPQTMGIDDDAMWSKISAIEPLLSELVEWSDIIICEWAGVHALWLSRYLPKSARLIIRLHSYEAFSQWPLFMNWGGVDGVVFVADHIRQFARRQYGLDRYRFLQTTVIPNFNHLGRLARPKAASARRTLGLFGYGNRNKDPLFAARTLALLAPTDPDWRLRLVGTPWKSDAVGKEADYRAEFDAFVKAENLEDRIDYMAFTQDLPGAFEDVGFVLSTSWREGTHESVLEGMASGAIPVIRRWPMTQPFGAPESVYPSLEYCDDPEGAAEIITRYADAGAFEAKSRAMIDYAMEHFDMAPVLPLFETFVAGVANATDGEGE